MLRAIYTVLTDPEVFSVTTNAIECVLEALGYGHEDTMLTTKEELLATLKKNEIAGERIWKFPVVFVVLGADEKGGCEVEGQIEELARIHEIKVISAGCPSGLY